jgi:uncharacterized protein
VPGDAADAAGPRQRRRVTTTLPRARRRRAPETAALTDRRRRVATLAGGGTAALLAAAASGATWYYADRITDPPGGGPAAALPADAARVVAVTDGRVHLEGPAADRPGWWGLLGHDGWCRVGPPAPRDVSATDAPVARPVELLTGALTPGDAVRFDPDAVPPEITDLGLTVEEHPVTGPVGELPAWWFPPPPDHAARTAGPVRAAVLVHGRSGSRRETARWVPVLSAAGYGCLAISYRNAPGAPPSPDGRSHLGATEWADLAAALDTVRMLGADEVVLVGISMGGACIAELLRRRDDVDDVRGVVLDAPVRHWGPVLRAAARQRGLPPAVVPLLLPPTMALAGARRQIDWRGLDHLDDPVRYTLPTLLLHGTGDLTVPVALSDAFAAARPDVVTYHRVPDAGHVRTWNHDRHGCEEALRGFLAGLDRASAR